jgi:hypothetical protein
LCRTLTALRARRAIAFPDARQVRICDREVLEGVCDRLGKQGSRPVEARPGERTHYGSFYEHAP